MGAETAGTLPQTCCPTVWLWPGQALYAGPSLNLQPLPLSVCGLYSCGVPLRGWGFGLTASGLTWVRSYGCSAGAG
jgi:hypothetical protein